MSVGGGVQICYTSLHVNQRRRVNYSKPNLLSLVDDKHDDVTVLSNDAISYPGKVKLSPLLFFVLLHSRNLSSK